MEEMQSNLSAPSIRLRNIICPELYSFDSIIGYEEIKKRAHEKSAFDINILIMGETGVGKELFAAAIHNASARKKYPYIYCNCSTIPSTLLESELFGHLKGAFTDAKEDRIGRIESAHRGTLFLDEIGNISSEDQAKILRAIEYRNINRIGENKSRSIDVRYIFATNMDLKVALSSNRFRPDLYHRINAHTIEIPPLRRRKKDIPKIVTYYWKSFEKSSRLMTDPLTHEEMRLLMDYDYPGNIRELVGILERIFIFSCVNKDISRLEFVRGSLSSNDITPRLPLRLIVKEYIQRVVEHTKTISEASRILEVDRKTVEKYLDEKK